MKIYLGADWSATGVVCAVAGEDGKPRRIKGAIPTLASVRDLIARASEGLGDRTVYVMLEAGAPIWAWLFFTAGAVVHLADPKQSKRFAQSQCSSGAKDDPRDASSLTDMVRSPAHRREPWAPDPVVMQQLDLLASMHEQGTSDLGRCKQRLRSTIAAHMPLVEAALSKNLRATWVDLFLRAVSTPWHAEGLTRVGLDQLVKGSRIRQTSRDALWKALEQSKAPWMTEPVANTIALRVHALLDQIALCGKQLDEVEARMDELTKALPTRRLMESMPGIAMKQAATLIQFAFRDGPPVDRDTASVRMGASPVFTGSGRRRDGTAKGHVMMRRAAPCRARRATYLIGRLASQHLSWAKAMYADARSRNQKPATAYRRITRCVLRIHTSMVRTGEPYDDARYVAALKAKGVRWAADLELAA